ncbi:MAG: hypothetical protein HY901_35765 [Deltaproteobacteria bacterium]|nr:hypothetical protein [Deltaproteobacteria bacterium]
MSKSKSAQGSRRVLDRLRSHEPANVLASELGVKDSEVAAARELVRHIGEHQAVAAGQLPDQLAQAVVEAAVQIEHAAFLKAVAEQGAKGAASAARRGLSILRSKGIEIELAQSGQPVFKAEASHPDDLACFISTCDTNGDRALWVPRAIRGGLQLVTALISDVRGVEHVVTDEVSRKSFKRLREELLERAGPHGITLIEIPPARARGYLAKARALTPNGLSIDQEAQLSSLLGDPKDATSPAYAEPPLPAEQEARRLAEGGQLFEEREVKPWIPDADAVRSLALKLDEISTSALYVDEVQRREQVAVEVDRAVVGYFDATRRSRYSQRLFELMEAFRAQKRGDAAERAGAAARALAGTQIASTAIPFCRQMFEKLLLALRPGSGAPAPAPAPTAQGLIVPG